MASVFTQIIDGNLPGHFVWKDSLCVAFMTIGPVKDGHLLVVPREEVDHWDDMPADTALHLMAVSQKITKGLKVAFPSERVGMIIAGFEVPHTHIHLIPVDCMEDFDFTKVFSPSAEALAANAEKVRGALIAQGCSEAEGI